MCGIFFYKNGDVISAELEEILINYLNRIKHRGPDDTSYMIDEDKFIGFHRLAQKYDSKYIKDASLFDFFSFDNVLGGPHVCIFH